MGGLDHCKRNTTEYRGKIRKVRFPACLTRVKGSSPFLSSGTSWTETNMKEGLKGKLKNDADIKCLQPQMHILCSCIQQLTGILCSPCGTFLYQNIVMKILENLASLY